MEIKNFRDLLAKHPLPWRTQDTQWSEQWPVNRLILDANGNGVDLWFDDLKVDGATIVEMINVFQLPDAKKSRWITYDDEVFEVVKVGDYISNDSSDYPQSFWQVISPGRHRGEIKELSQRDDRLYSSAKDAVESVIRVLENRRMYEIKEATLRDVRLAKLRKRVVELLDNG